MIHTMPPPLTPPVHLNTPNPPAKVMVYAQLPGPPPLTNGFGSTAVPVQQIVLKKSPSEVMLAVLTNGTCATCPVQGAVNSVKW